MRERWEWASGYPRSADSYELSWTVTPGGESADRDHTVVQDRITEGSGRAWAPVGALGVCTSLGVGEPVRPLPWAQWAPEGWVFGK